MASATASKTYDFVVVGAGPAGCVIASRLAQTPSKPTVLLVEAGGRNDDVNNRMLTHKFLTQLVPGMAWKYLAEPSPTQAGQTANLSRGKGLGGSSAINFAVWTEGTKADWDRMADRLGDDAWRWERVKPRYNSLTTHHCKYPDVRPENQKYVGQTEGNYGTSGPLHIGYPEVMDDESMEMTRILEGCGIPFRPEANNGTWSGVYAGPETMWRGTRSTAADLLDHCSDNLEVVIEAPIARAILEGDRAVGVEAVDGRVFRASKEVIICAGTFDSPKILMHSGIGPEDQLSQFGIPIARANPHVGQDFQDHVYVNMDFVCDEALTKRHLLFRDEEAKKAALRSWKMHRTGPYASLGGSVIMAFARPEKLLASPELAAMPEEVRNHLTSTDTPLAECGFHGLAFGYLLDPQNTPPTFNTFMMLQHLQSRGHFDLQSADPSVPLKFHTGWFTHEFDRRHAVETTRHMLALLRKGDFPKWIKSPLRVPASESEEDILDYWYQDGLTSFHSTSTCKMGRREVEDAAVVDVDFRVHGFKGLRVADNSIIPICPTGHIQAAAYQVGMVAAEKLIADYELA